MAIDGLLVALMVFMMFRGVRTGAMMQAIRLGAAVVAIALTPITVPFVRRLVFDETALSGPLIEVASIAMACGGCYAAIRLSGWMVVKLLRYTIPGLGWADMLAGGLIGAAKGALASIVLASMAILMFGWFSSFDPNDRLHLRDGAMTQWVDGYHSYFAWQYPRLKELGTLVQAATTEDADWTQRLAPGEQHALDLLRYPGVDALLSDPSFVDRVQNGKMGSWLQDERVAALMRDPDFLEALDKVEWSRIEAALQTSASAADSLLQMSQAWPVESLRTAWLGIN